jgi:hypothetical protein
MTGINASVARLALATALLAGWLGAPACASGQAVVPLRSAAAGPASESRCEMHAIRRHEVMIAAQMVNWEPVDDQSVLIWTGGSTRAHLVRLAQPLAGLAEAPMISLVDGDGDGAISPCGDDTVAVGEDAGGVRDGAARVRIVSIRPLSAKRTAQLDRGARMGPQLSART